MNPLIFADPTYLDQYLSSRAGEERLGEQLSLPNNGDLTLSLADFKRDGIRFVLLGIPEDLGPRANLGRGGSDQGWAAFLGRFCNLQHNAFIKGSELALLGHIQCHDLQEQSHRLDLSKAADLTQLRLLVARLDQRVTEVVAEIVRHDLIPIIIGGGHNNAYPIIKAISLAKETTIAAINLDPHTDFRALEGRHSGNGFSYASEQNFLSHYFSLGMHELKNSAANLKSLNNQHFPTISYQQIWTRREMTLEQALRVASCYLADSGKPIGLELDLDSISFMPASAYTNCGVSICDAQFYVHTIGSLAKCCYLHLAEGAPIQHPAGLASGINDVGQAYAALVTSFIQAKQGIGEE
jgi:formiminoglutamase